MQNRSIISGGGNTLANSGELQQYLLGRGVINPATAGARDASLSSAGGTWRKVKQNERVRSYVYFSDRRTDFHD